MNPMGLSALSLKCECTLIGTPGNGVERRKISPFVWYILHHDRSINIHHYNTTVLWSLDHKASNIWKLPNICLHCCVSTTYEENQEGSTPNSGLPNILRAFHGCFFQLEKVNAMAELATWVAMTNFIFMIYFFPWNDSQEVLTKTLVVFSGSIWEGEWYSNKAKWNGSVPDFASKPMLWLVRISED